MSERSRDPKLPFASFFRTHPYSDDRAEAIGTLYDQFQQADPCNDLYIGRKNLALRVAKTAQQFSE